MFTYFNVTFMNFFRNKKKDTSHFCYIILIEILIRLIIADYIFKKIGNKY